MRGTDRKWTRTEENKLRRLYPLKPTADLVAVFKRTDKAIGSRAKILGLVKKDRYKHWTAAEKRELKKLYPNTSTAELTKLFKCKKSHVYNQAQRMKLSKSREYISNLGRGNLMIAGTPHRFKKGQTPPNKGVKGWDSGGRSHETRFKKGQKPQTWLPVGSYRYQDGYLQRKIKDTGYMYNDWRPVHVLLWEKHRGKVRKNQCVVFKDGNRNNIKLRNLELITRRQLMLRNTIHRYPPEVKDAIRRVAGLKRRIRNMEKKANERKQS